VFVGWSVRSFVGVFVGMFVSVFLTVYPQCVQDGTRK